MNYNQLHYQYEQTMIDAFHCMSRKEAIKLIHKADKLKQVMEAVRRNAHKELEEGSPVS